MNKYFECLINIHCLKIMLFESNKINSIKLNLKLLKLLPCKINVMYQNEQTYTA